MRPVIIIISFLVFIAAPAFLRPPSYSKGVEYAMDHFRTGSLEFARSCTALRKSIQAMKAGDPRSVAEARQKLANTRYRYKAIESFLEYFFRSSSTIYNKPPKYEADEPDMEYQSPVGLQVIESLVYEKKINKQELLQQTKAVESSASDLPALLYNLEAEDRQLLESLRIELIRIMALNITGYEAPLLKSGITESYEALSSFRYQLQPYLVHGEPRSDSLQLFLDQAIGFLHDHPDFDSFDRLAFLTRRALPLQRQLGLFIREKKLLLNTNEALNYDADHLFSAGALVPEHFPGVGSGNRIALSNLGMKLFADSSLSGNGKKSCASCHDPGKMFTDRLQLSIASDGHNKLNRNAPSLLYSGFQYSQFWDGRAKSLEDQIKTVLYDQREMNADSASLLKWMKNHRNDSCFQKASPGDAENPLELVSAAIAAYVRNLHPMNSAFDRYMQGAETALNTREKKGANLFMGKAQCATCHFIPLFNGLIPPDYALTEFEVLGTTSTDRFKDPKLSSDQGRYTVYPFPFYKGAFKTPTVRNAALTYPYMHNGSLKSLKKVMEFYNKGGGAGLGLHVPNQTLSSVPLNLSDAEIDDIILFIHALTDSSYYK
jgi:cytochrome c peroxidase